MSEETLKDESAPEETNVEETAPEETPAAEATPEETPALPEMEEHISSEEAPAEDASPEEATAHQPTKSLKQILEAVLFASQKPLSVKELVASLKGAAETEHPDALTYAKCKEPQIRDAMDELAADCAAENRTYDVRETASGWQLVTRPDFAPWLRQLYPENRPAKLSAPALETLAIIAYRQPITRADLEAVRGVAVDGVMQTLLDRGLVRIAGRAEIPGRPLLYETTQFFMEHFGLKDLDELPNAGELRKIELPKAEVPQAEPPKAEEKPAETPEPSEAPSDSPAPEPQPEANAESPVEDPAPAEAEDPTAPEEPASEDEESKS